MTAPKELHDRIDRLSPEGVQALQTFLERQEHVERQMAALHAFASDWTPDEQVAWEEGTQRRPWHSPRGAR
ncbi:hypothetical protein [Deinococcus multiflagellatus]|uniref:Uncharacterized protein n=1 Tax=Deinococcus multiflagellatus TaxID=1656887 RepID=A0ABW1ZIN6_9DEIO|nr:hypothetical protein [Deinococcus multiflagellatus]MBZ9712577.1 hypothetical protein [Deinococcus multiflagellatus]